MSALHPFRFRRWLLQSPPMEWALRQLRELLIGAIRHGPVPQHIAFIMDGNRRFARRRRIENAEGHSKGFEALARILEVCYKSGVKVVTIYAFSIENFNRSKYEVDTLFDMAKLKLSQMILHGDLLDQYGACIRFLGQRSLVRKDVLDIIDRAVDMTRKNQSAILNVCFPYTSRNEITTAIRSTIIDYTIPLKPIDRGLFSESRIARNIRTQRLSTVTEEADGIAGNEASSHSNGDNMDDSTSNASSQSLASSFTLTASPPEMDTAEAIESQAKYPDPESITADTLTDHMYTAGCPPVDILIRTSGVERLSDFLLWQCHQDTSLIFLKCLWPEFDLWVFLPVLAEWQRAQRKLKEEKASDPRLPSVFTALKAE